MILKAVFWQLMDRDTGIRISHPYKPKQDHPLWGGLVLAESVRFELTVGFPITSFQDWLLKPLGQLSVWGKS